MKPLIKILKDKLSEQVDTGATIMEQLINKLEEAFGERDAAREMHAGISSNHPEGGGQSKPVTVRPSAGHANVLHSAGSLGEATGHVKSLHAAGKLPKGASVTVHHRDGSPAVTMKHHPDGHLESVFH